MIIIIRIKIIYLWIIISLLFFIVLWLLLLCYHLIVFFSPVNFCSYLFVELQPLTIQTLRDANVTVVLSLFVYFDWFQHLGNFVAATSVLLQDSTRVQCQPGKFYCESQINVVWCAIVFRLVERTKVQRQHWGFSQFSNTCLSFSF